MKKLLFKVVVLLVVSLGWWPEIVMAGEDSHTSLAVIQKTLAEQRDWTQDDAKEAGEAMEAAKAAGETEPATLAEPAAEELDATAEEA